MELGLRHVQVVLAVAEAGSINRAAARLKIAQAGLTAQLHRIEDGLGGPLFVRRSDGVTLTDLGVHVVRRGRELTEQFDDLLHTAKLIGRQERATTAIRIGGTDPVFLPLLVSAVGRLLPHREQVTRQQSAADATWELLRSRDLDMAVVAACPQLPTVSTGDVTVRELAVEPFQIVLPAGHRLAPRPEVSLADLAGEPWVVPDDRIDGLRLSLRLACEGAGFTPRFRHFGLDAAAAASVVAGGHAVALVRGGELPHPGLVRRTISGDPVRVRSLLAWAADSPLVDLVDDIQVLLLAIHVVALAQPVPAGSPAG